MMKPIFELMGGWWLCMLFRGWWWETQPFLTTFFGLTDLVVILGFQISYQVGLVIFTEAPVSSQQ